MQKMNGHAGTRGLSAEKGFSKVPLAGLRGLRDSVRPFLQWVGVFSNDSPLFLGVFD